MRFEENGRTNLAPIECGARGASGVSTTFGRRPALATSKAAHSPLRGVERLISCSCGTLDEANQMRRREFVSLSSGTLTWRAIAAHGWAVALPICARAQAAIKRIGFLRIGPPPSAWIEALRQGLRELGYTEGRDIAFEFGLAPDAAQLPDALAGFDRLNVDVIFASGTPPLLAAKQAQGSVPVVFVAAVDPVATGLVASLARPGGKITGLTNTQADITGKQLQLLRELLPGISKIAVMVRAASEASARYLEEAAMAARALGAQL
jgi:putative tryptophan/tyrosine transport system substrate-binding protein